jgi:hypothetical protein
MSDNAQAPAYQPAEPKKDRKPVLIIVGVFAALVVAAVAVLVLHTETFDVSGSMTLFDDDSADSTGFCSGTGGYDDIAAGTEVVVYDNAGAMLATGVLDSGFADVEGMCTFEFTVADVPVADKDLYAIEVAHRGKITFTQAEAKSVGLSLGG